MEDDYNEATDSDFQEDGGGNQDPNSTSEDEEGADGDTPQRPRKRQKLKPAPEEAVEELDSGDEATIRERRKARRKQKKQGDATLDDSENESEGWRARTRAMRTKEKEERKFNTLASIKNSTVDVDKLWEDMNRPGPLPQPRMEGDSMNREFRAKEQKTSLSIDPREADVDKENVPMKEAEETITIKRTYKFAGEIHVEEKTVLKSSAEAQLWLSQQPSSTSPAPASDGKVLSRPVRKISRFDPNISNLETFRASWAGKNALGTNFKGPKLNVVEKSKMDWASHVDTVGLKEELDTHAKAREGYLGRMDFLRGVEERQDADARAARLKTS